MYKKSFALFGCLLLVVAAIGCGGGGGGDDYMNESGGDAAPAEGGGEAAAPAASAGPVGNGTIAGKIAFDGEAPAPEKIKMKADPVCNKMHPEGAVSDAVQVADGMLANVFVYVKDYSGAKPAVDGAVMLDQVGCTYTPHVFGVQVGQAIKILNSDETLHNIHALPKTNSEFNLAMPTKGMEMERTFEKAEMAVKFKCDVHPWMAAYCHVMDHPFFAVSAADGSFEISGLPAGSYTVEAWHEVFGTQTMEVTVADDAPGAADFTFAAS